MTIDTSPLDATESHRLTFSFEPRPPYRARAQRQLPSDAIERFQRWVRAELCATSRVQITAAEWVSFDTRDAPHVTFVTVMNGAREVAFSVAKPLEGLEREDLPRVLFDAEPGSWRRSGT